MIHTPSRCSAAAEEISRWLQTGIEVGPSVQQFVRSAFTDASPSEMAALLARESGCEKDSLLDLLFFPDETLQISLEKRIGTETFEDRDEPVIVRLVVHQNPEAEIRFPEEDRRVSVPVPDYLVANLVRRLRLSRRLDAHLSDVLAANLPASAVPGIRVKIRHADLPPNPVVTAFLCRFFETLPCHEKHFSTCLGFLLSFVGELAHDIDMEKALVDKRHKLAAQVTKANAFHDRLQKTNMETMMLAGHKAPAIDLDRTREIIGIIDRLIHTFFDRSASIGDRHENHFTLDGPDNLEELDNLFRLLS